jgi:hypothetical protein
MRLLILITPDKPRPCKYGCIHGYALEVLRASPAFASVRCVTETMTYLKDGWVLWHRGTGGTTDGITVYAHLWAEEEGGRGEITRLAIEGRTLTTERLRSVPLARIETLANTNPDFRPHIAGTEQHGISDAFDQVRNQANGVMMENARPKAEEFDRKAQRAPLTRPDGKDPDAFYERVAEAYREMVLTHRNVAVALAEEAKVPVGTVHRWVLEARRRKFLPPARQGRVG